MNPRETYVNPLLTDISVAYENKNLIGELIFPSVPVDRETGEYFVVDRENQRTPADARRADLGRANRVNNDMTTATYSLEERSLETPITDRIMRNYQDPFDPKKNATNLVTGKLNLLKEKEIRTAILNSGAPGLDENGAWSTITTDIVGHVRTARNSVLQNTGFDANVMIIGKPALDELLKNTALIEGIKYTQAVSEEALINALQGYFDIPKILIGKATENTAKEGQADSMNFIWGEEAIVAYVPDAPALETPSAGYLLQLRDARYVDEWYEQDIKTTFVRANDFFQAKIVDINAMYIFTDVKA